jgi:ribonuclease III
LAFNKISSPTKVEKIFTKQFDKNFKSWIKSTTGFIPKNLSLYHQAFAHSSVTSKKSNSKPSYERLEFLGDAILGAVVADYLFSIYVNKDEGFLTQLRSKIVNGQSLKELALKLGFNVFLRTSLSKDERGKSSALGDAFEAFVGAVYLDMGYQKAKKFVIHKIIKLHLDIKELEKTNDDYKSILQIYCQKNKLRLEYKLVKEENHGANKLYAIQVVINGQPYVTFENFSKRVAEQKSAQLTLVELQQVIG